MRCLLRGNVGQGDVARQQLDEANKVRVRLFVILGKGFVGAIGRRGRSGGRRLCGAVLPGNMALPSWVIVGAKGGEA